MSRWRPAIEGDPILTDVFPTLIAPKDPWAGDDHLIAPVPYENHLRHTRNNPTLSEAAHTELDAQFCDQYRAVLCGALPWDALSPTVAALGLDAPLTFDRHRPPDPTHPLDDEVLTDVCEDFVPDVGVIAPDRVLGPMSTLSPPKKITALAGAVMSFAPLLRDGVVPLSRAVIQRPRPQPEISAAIRSAARTPPMLWTHRAGSLQPMLPLSPRLQPSAPLHSPFVGTAMVARAVPHVHGGAWLAAALPLPQCPPPDIIMRRMTLELWRLRRHNHRTSWEDVLRNRGEVLYRTACEWCWWHAPDETRVLWAQHR